MHEKGNKFISGLKERQKKSDKESKLTVAVNIETKACPNKSNRLNTLAKKTKQIDVLRTEKDAAMNEKGNKIISGFKERQKKSDKESKLTVAVENGTKVVSNKSTCLDTKLKKTKHVEILRTENEDSFGDATTSFMPYAEKLFRSKRGQYKPLKAIAGVVAGIIAGGILFVLLQFSFDYNLGEALVIAGGATIIMSICLAVSSFCRCIMSLVLPNFFTGKGRAVFLSIIFGIMLTNPVANITRNANATGNSMMCMTQMLVNQSRAMQRGLGVPMDKLSRYVGKKKEQLDAATAGFKGTLDALRNPVNEFKNGVKKVVGAIDELEEECNEYLEDVKDVCLKGCDLKVYNFCDKCHKISGNCDHIGGALEVTGVFAAARQVIQFLDGVQNNLSTYVKLKAPIYVAKASAKDVLEEIRNIQKDIYGDIESKAKAFETIIGVIKKVLSISLVLIFLQSFWYLRNYLARDGYDNIYITKQFEKLDKNSPSRVLPLKQKEKGKYVITSSVKLGASELAYCKAGMFEVMLHLILCLIVVTFDIALHYILSQVGRYAVISVSAESHGSFKVDVDGSGFLAKFYRIMLEFDDLDATFEMNLDVAECFPKPSTPSTSSIPVFIILYVFAFAFVVLRGYGMRLRRHIAAYFYPEQEQSRLEYLRLKIQDKRTGVLFMRQQIMSAHKESRVNEKWWNFPCLTRCKPGKNTLECTSCKQKESSVHHIELTPCRSDTGGGSCDAVYCEECLPALNGVCPICSMDDMTLRE